MELDISVGIDSFLQQHVKLKTFPRVINRVSIGSAQTIPKSQIPQINKWVLRELRAVGGAQIERLDSMPSALYPFSLESDNKVAGTEQGDSWLENKSLGIVKDFHYFILGFIYWRKLS